MHQSLTSVPAGPAVLVIVLANAFSASVYCADNVDSSVSVASNLVFVAV
jgi:hypothetical protein